MPQPIQNTRVSYTVTTATAGPFVVPFRFFDAADLKVEKDGVEVVGFSVTGQGSLTGGTLTLSVAVSSCEIVIFRGTATQRATDFPATGPLRSDKLNTDLDRLTAIGQDQAAAIARSIRLPDGEDITPPLPAAPARRNGVVGFDAVGRQTLYPVFAGGIVPEADAIAYSSAGASGVARTVADKLRDRASIADYSSLSDAFVALSGPEGTGYGARPVDLDLLGQEVEFSGTLFLPINISLINGTITATGESRLVMRNPYLADTTLRGYTEYWPYMKSRHRGVVFNCRVVINLYIGADFDCCDFTGANGALVLVNSNALWTEFNTFRRCSFSSSSADGAAILLDGNSDGTSAYSTGSGSGTADGSFGYNTWIDCKGDNTAPAVCLKITGGGVLYNGELSFRGYPRGAGPSGGFVYLENGRIDRCRWGLNLESFGDASLAVSCGASGGLWYNTGYIISASPEVGFAQETGADLRGNDIRVIGCVLEDSAGSTVFLGDTVTSRIVGHLSRRSAPSRAPVMSAYLSADAGFSSNVATKITMDAEIFDSASAFSAGRFQPRVAGYYHVAIYAGVTATIDATACALHIFKNGTSYLSAAGALGASMTRAVAAIVHLNGSTDYLEPYIYAFDNSGPPVVKGGNGSTFMSIGLLKEDA